MTSLLTKRIPPASGIQVRVLDLVLYPVESSLVVAGKLIICSKVVRFHTSGLMKVCRKCEIEKEEKDFAKKGKGLDSFCRACHSIISKAHYRANKSRYRELIDKRIAELYDWFRSFKKTLKCERCNEDDYACLDFHHLDPTTKERGICQIVNSGWCRERIQKEIDKCIILCSNCHRKLHAREKEQLQILACPADSGDEFSNLI